MHMVLKQIIKVNDIRPADKFFDPITLIDADYHSRHTVTWWIMRYTLTHVSEAEGIMWSDINFDDNTIAIQLNRMRPLKTNSRRRVLPMVTPLREVLLKWKKLTRGHVGCIFGKYYKDPGSIMRRHMQQIKGPDIYFDRKGRMHYYTPKKAKDYSNTVLKAKMIGYQDAYRSYVNGHESYLKNETDTYGDNYNYDTLLEILNLLVKHPYIG